jgi:hypothetical protein
MAEKPTVQEPIQVKEPAKPEAKPAATADIDKLISQLDKVGIKSTEDLEGTVTAARQAGRLANLLGEANKRISELETVVRSKPQTVQEPETGAIDLRKEIEGAMERFYVEKVVKPQQMASDRFYADLEYVESSEHFPLVQDEWKEHFQSPKTQRRLAKGETDVAKEFQRLVMDKYRSIALLARDTLKQVKETGTTKPPHVESGTPRATVTPTSKEERQEQLGEIKKNWRGEDSDVDKALSIILKDFR